MFNLKSGRVLETAAIFQAHYGAAKMDGQGYRYDRNRYSPNTATVVSPEGKRYRTHCKHGAGDWKSYCNCPQGQEQGICKHQIWLGEKLDEERDLDARAEAEAILREETLDAEERYWSR